MHATSKICPVASISAVQPVGELWRRTESLLLGKGNTADVQLSDDPGNYLWGFIRYEGLVERWRHGEQRNVLFLHVKPWPDNERVQEGREVVMAVIRAAMEMIEKRRDKKEKEEVAGLSSCCVVAESSAREQEFLNGWIEYSTDRRSSYCMFAFGLRTIKLSDTPCLPKFLNQASHSPGD